MLAARVTAANAASVRAATTRAMLLRVSAARDQDMQAVVGEGKDFLVRLLHHLLRGQCSTSCRMGQQCPRPGLHMQMVRGRRAARRPVVEYPVVWLPAPRPDRAASRKLPAMACGRVAARQR